MTGINSLQTNPSKLGDFDWDYHFSRYTKTWQLSAIALTIAHL